MNLKRYIDVDSPYFRFLQNIKNTTDQNEIEEVIEEIKKDYPVLLIDQFTPSAIYIMDYKHQNYPYMSRSVEGIIGYKAQLFYDKGISFTFSLIHPDDVDIITGPVMKTFLDRLNTISSGNLNNYRFSYSFRAKRSDGNYIHVLQQFTVALVDEYRNPILYIGAITDISTIKKDNSVIFSVARFDPQQKIFKELETLHLGSASPFSQRETQILKAIAAEKSNKEIAEMLHISEFTVKAHRRNIHKKTDCKKMSSAIAKSQKEGWI